MFPKATTFSKQYYQPIQPVEKLTFAVLVLFSAMLYLTTFFFDRSIAVSLTEEGGVFESVSPILWVALAALCAMLLGFRSRYGFGTTFLCLIFAAREMDLHKAFTADSIFKNSFYRMDVSILDKAMGGTVAIMCVSTLLWLLIAVIYYIYIESAWRRGWGRLTIIAVCFILFTKVMDRIGAILSVDYDYHLNQQTAMVFHMHEEGFEMLLPILFAIALITWRRDLLREAPRS